MPANGLLDRIFQVFVFILYPFEKEICYENISCDYLEKVAIHEIKNLTITHKKDLRVILKDFCLVLNPGDKAVIVGEEGNGKSTLLKWIWDPESIETYTEAEGEKILTRERLAYLPQELPKADSSKTIYEYFSEIPSFWEASPKELGQMAGRLHLARDIFYSEQKLGELSGGEKIKIQMRRILLT